MTLNDPKDKKKRLSESLRRTVVDDNRTQHVRLVFAIQRLEAALGQAAPGREQSWHSYVDKALDLLVAAMRESQDCVHHDDGLIEDIKIEKPFLCKRIGNLRAEFDGLLNQVVSLQQQVSNSDAQQEVGFADLRQRANWLLSALKHHQAKESDLIFEAINVDIGVGG